MNPIMLYALLAVFCGAGIRTIFGWLKAGGPFKFGKFLRTVLIAFVAALMVLGTKIVHMDPWQLFFSVLTMTYAMDDIKNLRKTPQVYEGE